MGGAGFAVGLTLCVLASQAVAVWLFNVPPLDPLTVGSTAEVVMAVSICASLIPAVAAVRIDPGRALRTD